MPMRMLIAFLVLVAVTAGTAFDTEGSVRRSTDRPTDARECLILALYHEARHESRRSILKHAWTIVWRVKRDDFPNDLCSVIYQPFAFQPFNGGKIPRMTDDEARDRVAAIAEEVLVKAFPDSFGGNVCVERDIHTGACIATRADLLPAPMPVSTHFAVADCYFLGREGYGYTRNDKDECVPSWSLKMTRVADAPCSLVSNRPCRIVFWRQ